MKNSSGDCKSISLASGGGDNDSATIERELGYKLNNNNNPNVNNITNNNISKNNNNNNDTSSTNLSILNESDSVSAIIRLRQENKENRPYSIKYDTADIGAEFYSDSNSNISFAPKSHFSPRSSIKIKVIDETDTDN